MVSLLPHHCPAPPTPRHAVGFPSLPRWSLGPRPCTAMTHLQIFASAAWPQCKLCGPSTVTAPPAQGPPGLAGGWGACGASPLCPPPLHWPSCFCCLGAGDADGEVVGCRRGGSGVHAALPSCQRASVGGRTKYLVGVWRLPLGSLPLVIPR